MPGLIAVGCIFIPFLSCSSDSLKINFYELQIKISEVVRESAVDPPRAMQGDRLCKFPVLSLHNYLTVQLDPGAVSGRATNAWGRPGNPTPAYDRNSIANTNPPYEQPSQEQSPFQHRFGGGAREHMHTPAVLSQESNYGPVQSYNFQNYDSYESQPRFSHYLQSQQVQNGHVLLLS